MYDLTNKDNEWLVVELKLCRSILGISQREFSEMSAMALQSIKRLEKKGAHPRYTTIIKIRDTFKRLGVVCEFDENGSIRSILSPELVEAINLGNLRDYVDRKIIDLEICNAKEESSSL